MAQFGEMAPRQFPQLPHMRAKAGRESAKGSWNSTTSALSRSRAAYWRGPQDQNDPLVQLSGSLVSLQSERRGMGERFYIIVVEDNRADLGLIKRSIHDAGINCDIVNFVDGAEAIAFINATASPVADLILLDLNLPAVEGASVLNSVRGSPRWSKAPVLIFTSSTAPADVARANNLGADSYIVKPGRLDEFVKIGNTIREWLEKRRASRT
jgi:CheY-like chemotaxis protein